MTRRKHPKAKQSEASLRNELAALKRQAAFLRKKNAAMDAIAGLSPNEIAEVIRLSSAAKAVKLARPAPTEMAMQRIIPKPVQQVASSELIEVHCDGGCRDNGTKDALGAWAFLVMNTGFEASDVLTETTNNRAELRAMIEAVRHIREAHSGHPIRVYSDSQLTIKCAGGVYKKKSNLDLWSEYESISKGLSITYQWVRAHSGIPGNERCDTLCNQEMDEYTERLSMPDDGIEHMRSIAGTAFDSGWLQQK